MNWRRIIVVGVVGGMIAVTGCSSNMPERNQGNRNGQRVADAVHHRTDSYDRPGVWRADNNGTVTRHRANNRHRGYHRGMEHNSVTRGVNRVTRGITNTAREVTDGVVGNTFRYGSHRNAAETNRTIQNSTRINTRGNELNTRDNARVNTRANTNVNARANESANTRVNTRANTRAHARANENVNTHVNTHATRSTNQNVQNTHNTNITTTPAPVTTAPQAIAQTPAATAPQVNTRSNAGRYGMNLNRNATTSTTPYQNRAARRATNRAGISTAPLTAESVTVAVTEDENLAFFRKNKEEAPTETPVPEPAKPEAKPSTVMVFDDSDYDDYDNGYNNSESDTNETQNRHYAPAQRAMK
ncbi:MAG: hypothetical protein FWE05_12440 [Defluviitaleaceae bacterium]|nr:hypothetical protein [Defluviitaleaceae bacterium]